MTKINNKGVYATPVLESLCIDCEQGFALSSGVDGLLPLPGEWDDENSSAF